MLTPSRTLAARGPLRSSCTCRAPIVDSYSAMKRRRDISGVAASHEPGNRNFSAHRTSLSFVRSRSPSRTLPPAPSRRRETSCRTQSRASGRSPPCHAMMMASLFMALPCSLQKREPGSRWYANREAGIAARTSGRRSVNGTGRASSRRISLVRTTIGNGTDALGWLDPRAMPGSW